MYGGAATSEMGASSRVTSNGLWPPDSARIAPVEASSSVRPSGGALATWRVPIRPAAPGRYSEITIWPQTACNLRTQHAAEHVGRAARRERHDDAHLSARDNFARAPAARRAAAGSGRRGARSCVVHLNEIKPFGRRDRPAGGAVARRENAREDRPRSTCPRPPAPASRPSSAPDCAGTSAPRFRSAPRRPSRTTSSRSSVFTGDFAWHSVERNVVKSCLPTRRCAAACIASVSSRRGTRQARSRSSAKSARRLTMR